jgi:hypothetical protein
MNLAAEKPTREFFLYQKGCIRRMYFELDVLRLGEHQVKVLLSDKTRAEEYSVQAWVEEKGLERDLPL